MRIVSVLPSATEIVCALGGRDELVGRSAECDFPPGVADVPIVMRPRTLDAGRPSAEIDARVRAARARNESLYTLDSALLRALGPDLLITQDLCGVCSVTGDEVAEACAAAGVDPRVVSLIPRNLEQVWETVETVGDAIGRAQAGHRLAEGLREVGRTPRSPAEGPRVAIVEWLDPPILAGLWTPDIVRAAGGAPLGPASGEAGHRTTWAALAELEPDLLVLSPCSFSVERTLRELRDPSLATSVAGLAPRLGTFVADEAFFSRPGPRLAEGIRLVRALAARERPTVPMAVEPWSVVRAEASA